MMLSSRELTLGSKEHTFAFGKVIAFVLGMKVKFLVLCLLF